MPLKVFISYDYDNDRDYKNLLLAWDANKQFDFKFYDQSIDVSVDSTDPGAIRRVISARINDSDRFLCIIGKKTALSTWVEWEITKAKELRKRLVGVKIEPTNSTPPGLLNAGASWAMSWSFEGIKRALT